MSGKKKGTYVELGGALDASLVAFCEAFHDASKSRVIRDALAAYIKNELRSNDGVRERYEALRQSERRRSSANLKIIDSS